MTLAVKFRASLLNFVLDHVSDADESYDAAPLVAEFEATVSELIGAKPCPDQMPHGHGRNQEHPFTDACPSCGAAL
jgi:hypothetical protein